VNETQLEDIAYLLCDHLSDREFDRPQLLTLEACALSCLDAARKSPACLWMVDALSAALDEFRERIRNREYKGRGRRRTA
jgi:hypothetical protein